jgi:hypothetical protein
MCRLLAIFSLALSLAAQERTEWRRDAGSWTDPSHWSAGLPTGYLSARVSGTSNLTIPPGTYVAGDLRIGEHSTDRARVEVNGGQLVLMQDSLHLGEDSGGEAEFILREGAMHCVMDVFVGGASGVPDRANKSALRIQGGSFLGRTLTVGTGRGSEALLSVEGSRATAIHTLDYVTIAGSSDPKGKAGSATLSFTLDEHGVTPITIQSRVRGLTIVQDPGSHVRLRIALSAPPPQGDIVLVASHAPTRGAFDGLPEGSEITAGFQGQTYRWQLTYRGGLALKGTGGTAGALPSPPPPLWRDHPLYTLSAQTGVPAFAGAEGFGAFTPGGRGGRTLYVDNLNDSGPGSLRAAIATPGPRIVRFRAGGDLTLKSAIQVDQPFLTIDGQDAPAGGITLRRHGLEVHTHDVVLRYFRIRIGDEDVHLDDKTVDYTGGDGEYALYFTHGSRNAIADHLSLSWSTAKMLSTTGMSDLITIQYCILSESLNFAGHGYASLAGGNRITWHHNLFAHHYGRNVRFQNMVDADFRNNVIYDWGDSSAYGEFDRLNYIGNYLKPGPSTTQVPPRFHDGVAVVAPGSLFAAGNILEGNAAMNEDNWRGMGVYAYMRAAVEATGPFSAPPVATETAQAAYVHVLKDAGASLPGRDPTDERIVRETREGTGHIIRWLRDIR